MTRLAHLLALACAFVFSATAAEPRLSDAKTPADAGMVDIADLVPDLIVDMRYAGSNNFVGQRIDGYRAPRCYLLRPVAQALKRVEAALRQQQLHLKIFDCYRPARAVRYFVEWAGNLDDQRNKADYYPNVDKKDLLGDYIAPVSGHSRGAAIDLTLVRCSNDGKDCNELDMGTSYDFFDARAHTDTPDIGEEQRENRHRLRRAMEREGFRNYELEWWHYTLMPEPTPELMYDVVIPCAFDHGAH